MTRLLCVAGLLLLLSIGITSSATGQAVPGVDRWQGGTAHSQIGFEQGDPITLTWGFAQEGIFVRPENFGFPGANNNLGAFMDSIYGNQGVWQGLFAQTFDRWSEISGVNFIHEPNDDGASLFVSPGVIGVRADIRIAGRPLNGNFGPAGYTFFPETGDTVLDTIDFGIFGNELLLRNLTAHEFGHGIGLNHVASSELFLMRTAVGPAFDGPQYHDILMAQFTYGDARENENNNAGNDTVANASQLGTVLPGNGIAIGLDADDLPVAPTEIDFFSIDDETDVDVYSFTVNDASTVSITVDAKGQTYGIAPLNSTPVAFNTMLRSDLAVELLDSSGTTLASSDNSGLGGVEQISFSLPAAGTYFVRITGTDNPDLIDVDTQFYGLAIDISAAAETFSPDSITLLQGVIGSGNETNLAASDNSDLSVRRNPQGLSAVVSFEAKGTASSSAPSQLSLTIEDSVFSRSAISRQTELFNYDTGAWEVVDTRNPSRFGDTTSVIDATGDVTRFVEPGTNCVEARFRFSSAVARAQFSANVDLISWTLQ